MGQKERQIENERKRSQIKIEKRKWKTIERGNSNIEEQRREIILSKNNGTYKLSYIYM